MNLTKINTSLYSLLLLLFVACNEKPKASDSDRVAQVDTALKWVDYRIGELPPVGYYDAIDSIIKKWNIRYERVEGGCEVISGEKESYEKHNYKYFQELEQKYGRDWRAKFDAEVQHLDSLFRLRNIATEDSISDLPPVKCVDKGGDMENGFTEECVYYKSTLAQAYASFRLRNIQNDNGKYLEVTMPKKELKANFKEYPLGIAYQYPSKETLYIEIDFPGGETYITFKQIGSTVKVTTVNAPD